MSRVTEMKTGGVALFAAGMLAFGATTVAGAEIDLTSDCLWADVIQSATDGSLTLTADSPRIVTVAEDAVLPDSLDIGANVSVKVAAGASLRRARLADIPSVTIRSGGHLGFHSQTARLLTPVDLYITTGGSLDMNYASGSSTRSAFIARTYYLDGVKQGAGTKRTSTAAGAPIVSRDENSAIFVPEWFWTGAAGDNVFETAGNWLGGSAPRTSAYSMYSPLDMSCATGVVTITSASELKVLGVSYLPTEGSALTLVASQSDAKISANGSSVGNGSGGTSPDYGIIGVCGAGAKLTFDVDYDNLAASSRKLYVGGGTWCFKREFSPNNGTAYPIVLLDGSFEVGGTISKTTLNWGRQGNNAQTWTFVDGADVSVTNLGSEPSGAAAGYGYRQNGGSVTAQYLCGSSARWDGDFTYTLNGGSLSVTTELILGGTQRIANTSNGVYPTGSLVMNGGTLSARKISNEFNSNYCRLLGGTATIGVDGFVRSTSTREKTVANTTSPIVLGAVTLQADGAGWSVSPDLTSGDVAGVSLEGAASGSGRTVFAPASGQTITVNGNVSGSGGFVKTGAGSLAFTGTYAASGDIRVENGTLALGVVSGTLNMLELASDSSLSVASDVTIQVNRLSVGGVRRGAGVYSFGGGSVQVSASVADWIGPEGGDWNTAANWSNGVVPNADDCELDFAYSTVSSISISAPVTLLGMSVPNSLTLTGSGVLTIATNGTINVAAGKTLTNDVPVHVGGPVQKTGGGRVVFTKLLRSSADPASFSGKQNYELRVVQGEGEVACAVNGIRLYADSQVAADDPLLVVSEGANVTNSFVHGPWTKLARAGYGRVEMNGGTVVIDGAEYFYGASGPNLRDYGFAYMEFGTCTFTLNNGTFVASQADNVRLNLHNNANDNGGEVTVVINGGSFIRSREYTGMVFGGSREDKLVMNGGSLEAYMFDISRRGRGRRILELNGGTLNTSRAISSDFDTVKIGGDVTFCQRYKYSESNKQPKIVPAVTGVGKIIQSGTACLWLDDVSGFAGGFEVTGGSIAFTGDAGFNADSSLSVAKNASVSLDYTGSKSIHALTLGGKVAHRDCAYGATGRGRAYFAGAGLLVPSTGTDVPGMCITIW